MYETGEQSKRKNISEEETAGKSISPTRLDRIIEQLTTMRTYSNTIYGKTDKIKTSLLGENPSDSSPSVAKNMPLGKLSIIESIIEDIFLNMDSTSDILTDIDNTI